MKVMLLIALTAIVVGYTSATGCFSFNFKCLGNQNNFQWDEEDQRASQSNNRVSQSDNRAPQSDNEAPRSNNRAPQSDNRAPQSDNRAPQSDNRAPQSDNRAPQNDNRASQSDNRASQSDNRASQSDNKVPRSDSRASQSDNRAPQSDYRAPQSYNRASQSDKRASQSDNRASQSNNRANMQETESFYRNIGPLLERTRPERMRTGSFRKNAQDENKAPQDDNRKTTEAGSSSKERLLGRTKHYVPRQDDNGDCRQGLPSFPCCGPILTFISGETAVDHLNCGKTFPLRFFRELPRVLWNQANKKTEYTVFVIGKTILGETLHWAVRDIPGSAFNGIGEIKMYKKLIDYETPQTNEELVVVIYRQTEKTRDSLQTLERNSRIDTKFVTEHDLYGPRAAVGAFVEN